MKKIYSFILLAGLGMSMNAQTLTVTNHAPAAGENFATLQCDSTNVTVGAVGQSTVWNYSSLVPHLSIQNNYTSSATTNTAWPSASVVVSSNTANSSFYSSTASNLKYWGGNLSFGAFSAILNYTAPSIHMAYPFSFGSNTISPIGGNITLLGNPGTFTGVSTVTSNATGTLVIPNFTFNNVIKVVTTQTISFTVVVSGTASLESTDFYSTADSKYPILSIQKSNINSPGGSSTQSFVTVQKAFTPTGVKELAEAGKNISVYPNPANMVLHINAEGSAASKAVIYDMIGKVVLTENMGSGKTSVNVSELNNGLYIYKVLDASGKTLKSGRVNVIH